MKFYDRQSEIKRLKNIATQTTTRSQMTFVTGRRRVGKTTLLKEAYKDSLYLYFFVARKTEPLLCTEFLEEIRLKLKIDIFGEITRFEDLLALLLKHASERQFTLIIDEFQEFYVINPSVYSVMQNLWDQNKDHTHLNLILCGSVYSLMHKIFEDAKEPLFGRADFRLKIGAFETPTLKQILSDNFPEYTAEDLLAFYTITGGMAKYVEVLVSENAFTYHRMMDAVFSQNSFFIEEGKNVLIEEFGRDYTTYFSILSLIASSRTSRPEMQALLGINLGGFLDKLEKDYDLISRVKPMYAKPGSRNLKYRINDNFLNFWFRFVFKYWSAVEIGNYDFLKSVVQRDYSVYSGKILERYFRQKLSEQMEYSSIGSYWEKGNLNEIDILAENALTKQILVAEVKRNKEKINLNTLKEKSLKLQANKPDYEFALKGFSMNDL